MSQSTTRNPDVVPLVDLSAFSRNGTPAEKRKQADDLVQACHNVGFVYISGHGVPDDALSETFRVSKKFFGMPVEDKMKAPHPPGYAVHRGYSWPGLEKVSNATSNGDTDVDKLREVQDFKESYEVGSDEDSEQPNVWLPEGVLPEWRPTMSAFYWTCWTAARNILEAFAFGLRVETETLLAAHDGHHNQLRLLHYPPIPADKLESGRFARMPTHSDWSTFTMLFQDDCGGLQVEHPAQSGKFIDISPIPGTIVLNIGDLLMRWSNGKHWPSSAKSRADKLPDYLVSTQHRVQQPPLEDRYDGENRMTRARYSIPYFVSANPDALIDCLRHEVGEKPKYEPMLQREYAAMRARAQY